jgi:glycosyltransferase involved in cell wall biosynthesis
LKIIQVTPWFPSFEIDTLESKQGIFEYRQARELAKKGHEFKIISIRWRGQSDYEIASDNIEVYRISPIFVFPRIRYPVPKLLTISSKIKKLCEIWNPDIIIYSHLIYLTTLPIFWVKNVPNVPTIVTTDVYPGISWFYGNKIVDYVGYLYSKYIGKRILNIADGVQLMNPRLEKDTIEMKIDTSKILVCSRGVDTEMFRPGTSENNLRNSLGVPENNIIIMYAGRLDLVKGVNYLIYAAERILQNKSNVTFLIVGDGGLRQKYEQTAKSLYPGIIFTGWREDVPQIMKIADMFVLPSLSEGAPNVIKEACASGLPVIATDVGAIPRIIDNGETGILVKPRDVNGLVEALESLIDNPLMAQRMGEMGRKRIMEQYDWKTICNDLEIGYINTIERVRLNDSCK